MNRKTTLFTLILIASAVCFQCEETNRMPACSITNPADGAVIAQGVTLTLSAEADDRDGTIAEVRFFINGKGMYASKHQPYRYDWNTTGIKPDAYTVKATSIDDLGGSASSEVTVIVSAGGETGETTDYDGNTYKTIKIGNQWWMAENLRSVHFPDGSAIPLVESQVAWKTLDYDDKACCYYDFNANNAPASFGVLYTWTSATNGQGGSDDYPSGIQGVCPDGWHLPADPEWKQLEMNLGMDKHEVNGRGWRGTDEGAQLKKAGSEHWDCPNTVASNASGFSALPAGYCYSTGFCEGQGTCTFFWTATDDFINAWYRNINCELEAVNRDKQYKNFGFSVRCVKN